MKETSEQAAGRRQNSQAGRLRYIGFALALCLLSLANAAAAADAPAGKVETTQAKARSHWAFQPVREPIVPSVKDKRFVQTPVDNFILAKLEAAALAPSPKADKRTLIRRATFDLTGLPPTPEEVAAFVADKSPEAFAKVVDRLLSSPRYGERWGRHWLDVARYADTKGYVFEEDRHYPYSYTYRDYVIRSFNEDLPYDQFIKEQIAADMLPDAGDKRALAALGYLTLGRRFVNNIHDIIDDRIDVVCRGMMGLTVSCARCHDHKFDPIPSRDYYSLYGVFASSMEPEQEPLLGTEAPGKAHDEYLAERKKRVDERDQYKKDHPGDDTPTQQKNRELQRHIDELDATSLGAPPRATALVDRPDPHNTHIFIRGNCDNQGAEAPREFLEVLSGPNRKPFQKGSGRLELAEAIASRDNPLTARVLVNRVWLHHFGSALVATPSDFGTRSDPPTHPELLDYLAARFMEDGWSIKKLHRLIMLSGTYQQNSENNAACARVDPGNQLLWRMNRQRLDFEAMRDTLLAVSGKLDLTAGGHAVDIIDPASTRRTVYGFVDRQNLPDEFRAFDFACPDSSSPRRFYTTVPQQALFMMNSPFVITQAKNLVARPDFHSASSDQQRLHLLYQLAFQRDPSREEIEWAGPLIRTPTKEVAATGTTNWQFGYGAYDEAASRVKTFHPLPHFNGHAFQGGSEMPDSKLRYVMLTDAGGHPGNDQDHAAIRRWLAPRDGTISISSTLAHPAAEGDGVRGRVVSSQLGLLGQWLVHNTKEAANFERVNVRRGDTIDFVTDCLGNDGYDSFSWSPTIRYLAAGKTAPGGRMEWSAARDFTDAARPPHPSLDAWQKYAQVLLMSDELVFVD